MSVDVLTFGCRLNTFESEVMKNHALSAGLSDTLIVNTCAVTAEATRQARQAIRKAHRRNPLQKIVVTGCGAQTEAEIFGAMPEVACVMGNAEKLKTESWRRGSNAPRVDVSDIFSPQAPRPALIERLTGRTRAFVQVQNGCDHRCTFCIIPFGRGNSRSVPAADVVRQVRRLVEEGYAEVVLSGVDLTSWGTDLEARPRLGSLVALLLGSVPGLHRLRLSSLDSVEVDEELLELLAAEERIMPHLHLSLQSGDNMILKRMKRRHSREDAIAFCSALRQRRPDMTFGADIIAGFPTETDEMFENSIRLVDDCGLTFLHVFPFSARPGTPAARMPQLDVTLIRARAARLRQKGSDALQNFLTAQTGKRHDILAETPAMGRTAQFAQVQFDQQVLPGHIVSATIVGVRDGKLVARMDGDSI